MLRYQPRYRIIQEDEFDFVVFDEKSQVALATCENGKYAQEIVEALNDYTLFQYDTETRDWVCKP